MLKLIQRPGMERKGPSFICIGPERTGTSWLYTNLKPHPEVFLPPVKEIRYFYEVLEYPGEGWRSRLSGKGDWHSQDYRCYVWERIQTYIRRPASLVRGGNRFLWDWRFVFGRRSNDWYLSLFEGTGERLAGDISPQYFSLPGRQIEQMRELLPEVKIIMLLRDPIDWSWSFARMTLVANRALEDVPEKDFFAFFDRYMNYYPTMAAIHKWRRHFPPQQVYIGFYDMLCEAPLAFYKEVCAFLGINVQAAPKEVLTRLPERVNAGRSLPLPHQFAVYLAWRWKDEIERLCQAFSPYPQRWSHRCNELLALDTTC